MQVVRSLGARCHPPAPIAPGQGRARQFVRQQHGPGRRGGAGGGRGCWRWCQRLSGAAGGRAVSPYSGQRLVGWAGRSALPDAARVGV